MVFLRKILFPFAILYHLVTSVRNLFFDKGWFVSNQFTIPIIAVGNLSVGGTGKSPQIEYLIRLCSDKYKIATLSRGYKRQTEDYVLANAQTVMADIGDEPFQFYSKFPTIRVAVDANRVNGIQKLLQLNSSPEVILLDDAYQHRKVKADTYVLLTAYSDLFMDDYILPAGNLRESRAGANRSAVVVVTKCPLDLSKTEQELIKNKIRKYTSSLVFFSGIVYDTEVFSSVDSLSVEAVQKESCLIVAGIAKPEPFYNFFRKQNGSNSYLTFPDHHNFSDADITKIKAEAGNNKIITTEKDYMRLKGLLPESQLYYLPIRTQFLGNEEVFQQLILDGIETKRSTN